MYLRHSRVRKNGKTHVYWRLVRSVRTGAKVRQQTVAYLGELDAAGRTKASALARHFLGPKVEQLALFEDRTPLAPAQVRLADVRVERGRAFGDVWLGWALWQAVGLDDFCRAHLPVGREAVPWAEIAAILVLARLCEPGSELHIAETWYRGTALPEVLGVPAARVHHTRLYEGLDRLRPHKVALEAHLKARLGTLFALEYDLLLYDVTSTYFEGEAAANPAARRGYSRDGRPQCKQVCLGLVVSREGYPLGYELFAGNRVDVTTVEDVVTAIEAKYGQAQRVWVMDRGMVSEANLAWLRAGGRRYLVGAPRSELRRWTSALEARTGWREIREGLEVQLCPGPDGTETFILCRSTARQTKEAAMHARFSERIVTGLTSLARRLETARAPLAAASVERQVGRLLERHSRAAGKFAVAVEPDAARASGLRLTWTERAEWATWARLTEGAYVLRSNVTDWSAEALWQTYVQLAEAEGAFRIQKSELRLRPIWHQKPERVEAHILVCFLAYVLWKTLAGWQQRAGLGDSPRTILDQLRQIQTVDVVLPLTNGPDVRLRCVVRPDRAQAALLDRLGLVLPRRLRAPRGLPEM